MVTGQYSVVLPDGRIQTVKYSVAPDTGYVVSYRVNIVQTVKYSVAPDTGHVVSYRVNIIQTVKYSVAPKTIG